MNNENLKNSIFSGVFWKFAERILAQGVSFIVSVILARILMPSDYGIVALILVFLLQPGSINISLFDFIYCCPIY